MAAMQVQIQALLAGGARGVGKREERREEEGAEVAKPQIFDGTPAKVGRFILACKLYIRMRMRGESVKGQVQWILSYMQGGSTDIWKENIIEELESGEIEYESAEEFLIGLKKEFGGEEEESVKAAELRKLENDGGVCAEIQEGSKRKWV